MRTASMCTPCVVRGTHTFKIAGYSFQKGVGVGAYIQSAAFEVGGYLWHIRYYPDGDYPDGDMLPVNGDRASISLQLASHNAKARAFYEVRLIDQANNLPPLVLMSQKTPAVFESNPPTCAGDDFQEPLPYVKDDSLLIECDLGVMMESKVAFTASTSGIQVPPSDLGKHFGDLLESEEDADLDFKVNGELYAAHRIVVVARSPVFKAELGVLFGGVSLSAGTRQIITIDDMQTGGVFRLLLHFIYTDSFPSMEELEEDGNRVLVMQLLVAADRYAIRRMKLICERILCKSLDVNNVTATLALADKHHSRNLKDACLEFITSPDKMDDVMASQGYADLKRSCLSVVIDVFERATKSSKI